MLRALALGGIGVALSIGGIAVVAWRATQRAPDFYQQALDLPPDIAASVDELERQVLNVHNDIQAAGLWEARFTDQEINAWVATHFDEEFGDLLPPNLRNPRLAIEAGRAHLACQYQSESLSAVLSLTVEAYLTAEPNVFAVQINSARAGLLPIPLKKIVGRLTAAARRSNLKVRWTQSDGSPVALVTLPVENEGLRDDILMKTLELRDGELFVAGCVEKPPVVATAQAEESVNSQL